MTDCPECNGSGVVYTEQYEDGEEIDRVSMTCPSCDGLGEIEE